MEATSDTIYMFSRVKCCSEVWEQTFLGDFVLCWTYKLCQRLPPLPLPIKFRGVRKILNQLGFWCCVLCLQPAPAKAQLLYQLIVWNYSWCKIFQTPRNFIGGGSGGNLWHNLYVQQSTCDIGNLRISFSKPLSIMHIEYTPRRKGISFKETKTSSQDRRTIG